MDHKFKNVFVVAGNVIEKNGRFLLVQETKKIAHGLYNLPAGKVEEGETIIETAIREAKEETGLTVKPVKIIGIFQNSNTNSSNLIDVIFKSEIVSGEITTSEEHPIVKFFTFDEIEDLGKKGLSRSDFVVKAIKNYIDNKFIDMSFLQIEG